MQKQGIVQSWMRTRSKVLAGVNLLILLLLSVILLANSRYFENAIFGPYPVSLTELAKPEDLYAKGLRYVRVTFGRVHDTGLEEHHRMRLGFTSIRHFYRVELPNREVLLETEGRSDLSGKEADVYLTSPREYIRTKVFPGLKESLGGTVPPDLITSYHISNRPYRTDAYMYLALLGIGIACSATFLVLNLLRSDLRQHPLWQRLSAFGPPDQLITGLNRELAEKDYVTVTDKGVVGTILLTRSWLVIRSLFSFQLVPLDDIVWLHSFTESRNGIKTYHLKIFLSSSEDPVEFPVSQQQETALHVLIASIMERRPWIIELSNPEAEKEWKKHRSSMLSDFERRRDECLRDANDEHA